MDMLPPQHRAIASIADLQAANQRFWSAINTSFAEQMRDRNFVERVMGHYSWTRIRENDFSKEKPLQFHALAVAQLIESENTAVRSELARKGGQAKRKSDLIDLIEKEFAKRNTINAPQLLELLRQDDTGAIDKIDDPNVVNNPEIHYFESNGKRKSVPISGLPDRLDRIRKRLFAPTSSRG